MSTRFDELLDAKSALIDVDEALERSSDHGATRATFVPNHELR